MASSFFFVGKKDGGLWPCIDHRTLNDHTVKLPYPLLRVPAALEGLRGARIFSKLNLWSAHNLVRICEGDERKTEFIIPSDHYEYRGMPYGLFNSPSVFQGFMNEVFRELLHCFVIVYIDNILIYSRNLAELQEAFCTTPIWNPNSHSLWKWDPPSAWEQCCHSTTEILPDSILVLISPGSFPQRSETTILLIRSCSPSRWRWRNGDTGWREHNTPLHHHGPQEL